MRTLKENLFLRTLVVVTIVGLVVIGGVTYLLRGLIESSVHEDAIRDATVIVEGTIMEVLGPQDLAQVIEGQQLEELDEHVQTHILAQHIERFNLWSPEGIVVYFSEPEQIGEFHPEREPLAEALRESTTQWVVGDPESAREPSPGDLFEAYIPLTWEPGVVAGVMEVYLPHAPYAAQINSQTRDIVLVAGLISIALAVALYLLYRTGWQAIRKERDVAVRGELERQRVQEARQESEALYRSLFDNAPVGIGIADLDGTLIACNDAMLRPGGYTREAIAGIRNVAELYFDPNERAEALALAQKQGFLQQHEVRFKRKDGTPYDCLLSLTLVTIGGRSCWLALSEDITERKLLQEQLVQAQKMEVVGQLAGGVAHDFNNLLTPILGISQMAADTLAAELPTREHLQQVQDAAERAAVLTQRLLTFSRRQVSEPRPVNLNDLVLGTERMLHHFIGEDIELAHLPAPGLGVVRVDPGQMEQVLLNMAVNARDAMPHGGSLTIETANLTLDPDFSI